MAVFAATGGLPVKQRTTQRQAYRLVEMQRWAAARRIPLVLHPRFYPADPSRGHRMLLAALRQGQDVAAFADAALRRCGRTSRTSPTPTRCCASPMRAASTAGRCSRRASDPTLAARGEALTQEAIARQVFGAPFFFYRGEPFWGQDRLEMLEDAITTQRAPIAYGNV